MKDPRPYQDERDLESMHNLLVQGRKADNGTYYVHIGDLNWWLYYPPLEWDFWDQIYLWDDPDQPWRLLGWVLISPDWVGFDVYFQPDLRGSLLARGMYLWAEERAMQNARTQSKKTINVLWVSHEDAVVTRYFAQRDYRLGRGMAHLSQILDEIIPPVQLAEGFEVRGCKGEVEVAAHARAQYGGLTRKPHLSATWSVLPTSCARRSIIPSWISWQWRQMGRLVLSASYGLTRSTGWGCSSRWALTRTSSVRGWGKP